MVPHALFFFGVAGVGKSFAGRELGRRMGYYHYELDQDLTPALRRAIGEKRPFSDEMRDEFFEVVARRISEVIHQHPRTIFTQGAYKERHRAMLRARIPELEFIWIQAPTALIEERLHGRGESVSADFAAIIARDFEAPPKEGLILMNDRCSADELAGRFTRLFC